MFFVFEIVRDGTKGERGDNKMGFIDRKDLLEAMDQGICKAAIMGMEDIEQAHGYGEHCDKQFVGTPVIELPWGIPVSEKFSRPLRTIMTEYMHEGKWIQIQNDARPQSTCAEQDVGAENTKLEIKHMAGAYVLSGILATLGIFLSITESTKKKRKAAHMLKALDDSEQEEILFGPNDPKTALDERPDVRDTEVAGEDEKDLHCLVVNLGKEIVELKQLLVSNNPTQ